MKTLFATSLVVAALLTSGPATADSWYSSHRTYGYDHHRGSGYYRDYYHNPRYSRHSYHRHRYAPYRHHGNSFSVSYTRGQSYYRYRHHDAHAGALVGGTVLGSLISSSLHDYESKHYRTVHRRPKVVGTRNVVYVNRPAQKAVGRRLLRDLRGNCFEISRGANGDELRTQLHPSACDF